MLKLLKIKIGWQYQKVTRKQTRAKSKAKVTWRVTWLEVTAAACRTRIVRRGTDIGGIVDLISVGQGLRCRLLALGMTNPRHSRSLNLSRRAGISTCYSGHVIARIRFISELLLSRLKLPNEISCCNTQNKVVITKLLQRLCVNIIKYLFKKYHLKYLSRPWLHFWSTIKHSKWQLL